MECTCPCNPSQLKPNPNLSTYPFSLSCAHVSCEYVQVYPFFKKKKKTGLYRLTFTPIFYFEIIGTLKILDTCI